MAQLSSRTTELISKQNFRNNTVSTIEVAIIIVTVNTGFVIMRQHSTKYETTFGATICQDHDQTRPPTDYIPWENAIIQVVVVVGAAVC